MKMENMPIKPRITLLDREQMEQVHAWSLKLLMHPGVRVDSNRAGKILEREIGTSGRNDRVRIPPELVAHALSSAPSIIEIFDRKGSPVFKLGSARPGQTRFGIGVANLHYQDPKTDTVVPFERKHMAIATRLGDSLSGFDVVSTPGVIGNMPPLKAELAAALEMIANTAKPLVILVSQADAFRSVISLLEHLHGDLSNRPFVIPYVNPISPLVMNRETTDKITHTIEKGLPLIYSNYGMAGATTPITPAGALVQLNAELLAGLVFTQLIKPGTPVILGSLPAWFNMKTMAAAYTTETMLLNMACAEMMHFYEIPHCGTSGSGPGWGPDLPAAAMFWMNHLLSLTGKAGLAPFVGGSFDSLVFSPAAVVLADEVIRQTRRFSEGVDLAHAEDALAEIETIGPAGNFLTSQSTLRLFRDIPLQSRIWPDLTLEKWRAAGCPGAGDLLRNHTAKLVDALSPPEDHDDLIAGGEAFIRRKR